MPTLTSGTISSVGGKLQDHQAVMQDQSQAVLGLSFVATSSTAFLGLLVLRSFSVELIEFDQVMQQKVLCNALLAQVIIFIHIWSESMEHTWERETVYITA